MEKIPDQYRQSHILRVFCRSFQTFLKIFEKMSRTWQQSIRTREPYVNIHFYTWTAAELALAAKQASSRK